MDIKEITFNVTNGPSKDLLFDNCKFWDNRSSNPLKSMVFFVVDIDHAIPGCAAVVETVENVNIQGIEHEDGSGHSFNLHGVASFMGRTRKFEAYYNSRSRKGHITLSQ